MPPLATDASKSVSIVSLVAALIEEAYADRASDIHIDPTPTHTRVRVRTDGMLSDRHVIPLYAHPEVIARIKVLSGLRTDEHQAPQDGRFRHTFANGEWVDIRVCIMPTYHGENAVLRLLLGERESHTLPTLGFSDADAERIAAAIKAPSGLLLATGPTGSGKTTTLYTLLRLIHSPELSIITVEDPIEYSIDGIRQIQVNRRTGLSFPTGLRALLRQDPDVIMVGEIRDTETACVAVDTALTGHRVLSTLHTNTAATALPRLLDMGVESYLLASTVELVVAQRLVRVLCECKEEIAIDASLLRHLPESAKNDAAWHTHSGCNDCKGTGFRGRTAISEVLVVNDAIREAIGKHAPGGEIEAIAKEEGMRTMLEEGIRKASLGITSIAEVLRAVHE